MIDSHICLGRYQAFIDLLEACEVSFIDETKYPDEKNVCHNEPDGYGLTFGHIRRARAAIIDIPIDPEVKRPEELE